VTVPGQIVILNGPPRSEKSAIASVVQASLSGLWVNLGVDASMRSTPGLLRPRIGLRPGGERRDLEDAVVVLLAALYQSIAAHARLGVHVVADVGHHESYSRRFPYSGTAPDGSVACQSCGSACVVPRGDLANAESRRGGRASTRLMTTYGTPSKVGSTKFTRTVTTTSK
jgi:chloramphenicol 3-O-phosphotransferase